LRFLRTVRSSFRDESAGSANIVHGECFGNGAHQMRGCARYNMTRPGGATELQPWPILLRRVARSSRAEPAPTPPREGEG
jgi:hypothetical protein